MHVWRNVNLIHQLVEYRTTVIRRRVCDYVEPRYLPSIEWRYAGEGRFILLLLTRVSPPQRQRTRAVLKVSAVHALYSILTSSVIPRYETWVSIFVQKLHTPKMITLFSESLGSFKVDSFNNTWYQFVSNWNSLKLSHSSSSGKVDSSSSQLNRCIHRNISALVFLVLESGKPPFCVVVIHPILNDVILVRCRSRRTTYLPEKSRSLTLRVFLLRCQASIATWNTKSSTRSMNINVPYRVSSNSFDD